MSCSHQCKPSDALRLIGTAATMDQLNQITLSLLSQKSEDKPEWIIKISERVEELDEIHVNLKCSISDRLREEIILLDSLPQLLSDITELVLSSESDDELSEIESYLKNLCSGPNKKLARAYAEIKQLISSKRRALHHSRLHRN